MAASLETIYQGNQIVETLSQDRALETPIPSVSQKLKESFFIDVDASQSKLLGFFLHLGVGIQGQPREQ